MKLSYARVRFVFPMADSLQGTTEEAAIDIAAFVVIFFETFSKFKSRALHMAGESYGVRQQSSPCICCAHAF